TSSNSSFSAAVKTAYMSPNMNVIKEWDDDNEAEINVSLADEDQLGVAARSQRVRITGHNDPRMESQRTAFQDGLDYLVVSTILGTVEEKDLKELMKMNGQRLASANLDKQSFIQGSLGLFEGNLILLQTLPNSFVTIQTIRQAIESIAHSGDEIEKSFGSGRDTQ
ncbi:MAG: type III secretion system chaperone, partial [Deinococcales bacterium]|nr:type III secretion system chaperone [Deinococcales bacterium]